MGRILSDLVPHLMRRLAPLALIPTLAWDPGFLVILCKERELGSWEPEPDRTATPSHRPRWIRASGARLIPLDASSGRSITTAREARHQGDLDSLPTDPGGHALEARSLARIPRIRMSSAAYRDLRLLMARLVCPASAQLPAVSLTQSPAITAPSSATPMGRFVAKPRRLRILLVLGP